MRQLQAILSALLALMKGFPRLFAPVLSALGPFGLIVSNLPTFIDLVKNISKLIKDANEDITVRRKIEEINNAFKESNAVDRARKLNDAFRL